MKRLTVVLAGGAMAASLAVGMLAAPLTARSAAADPHEYAGQPASLVQYAYPGNGGTGLLNSAGMCNFYNCGIGWL